MHLRSCLLCLPLLAAACGQIDETTPVEQARIEARPRPPAPDQPDASSSSGGGRGAGGASSSGGAPIATGSSSGEPKEEEPRGDWSVKVNGVEMTPTERFFTNTDMPDGRTRYAGYVYFEGPGLGPGSRFIFHAFNTGAGCEVLEGTQYQPDDGTFKTYFSLYGAAPPSDCGMTMTIVSPERLQGTFIGSMKTNGTETVTVEASIDIEAKPLF